MKLTYLPKNDIEILGVEILDMLSEKFPQTFFVGGIVRDILLDRNVNDIDIATIATPEQVTKTLHQVFKIDDSAKTFGVVKANNNVEITTFRVETYKDSRYPKVAFIDSVEADSLRRDFTINSLYMSGEGEIMDFHGGLSDIGKGLVNFIGDPEERILEDPLRIVRAIRFALQLQFKFEQKTFDAIQKNFSLIKKIKPQQLEQETKKLSAQLQNQFNLIINSKVLDESFVNSYNDVV